MQNLNNPEFIQNFDNLATEDLVSESLVKDSPHVRKKHVSKNEQFMMHVRSAMHLQDDQVSIASSVS